MQTQYYAETKMYPFDNVTKNARGYELAKI